MRVVTIYDDEREMILTYVSTYGLQRQSNKGKLSSNEVAKSPRLHIKHLNSHDKTILTQTFLGAHTWLDESPYWNVFRNHMYYKSY